jgi:hypothetical protein
LSVAFVIEAVKYLSCQVFTEERTVLNFILNYSENFIFLLNYLHKTHIFCQTARILTVHISVRVVKSVVQVYVVSSRQLVITLRYKIPKRDGQYLS